MTDEEMAEEYLQSIEGDDCVIIKDREERKEAFLAGLKAGRPQWHDLEENPNDLPEELKLRLSRTVVNQIGTPCHYNYELQCWLNWSFIPIETPIAWCEIPTFDKE